MNISRNGIFNVIIDRDYSRSKRWLGNHSPEKKIRESGLWQVKGLWGTPLDDEDIKYIEDL
jgi:hypothetical protein